MRINKQDGFTLNEVIVAMVIIAILAAIAIPTVVNWLPGIRLKGAANALVSRMQQAKVVSIRNNSFTEFGFTVGCNAPNYSFRDGNGVTFVNENLINGICLQDGSLLPGGAGFAALAPLPALPAVNTTGFQSRGIAGAAGSLQIVLTHPNTPRTYTITQSVAGGLTVQ